MRIVNEARERKRRPKLGEVISVYRRNKHQPGAKEKFQEKFRKLYSNEDKDEDEIENDEKYKMLIETMQRVKQ